MHRDLIPGSTTCRVDKKSSPDQVALNSPRKFSIPSRPRQTPPYGNPGCDHRQTSSSSNAATGPKSASPRPPPATYSASAR